MPTTVGVLAFQSPQMVRLTGVVGLERLSFLLHLFHAVSVLELEIVATKDDDLPNVHTVHDSLHS